MHGIVATGNGIVGLPQNIDIIAPKLPGQTLNVVAFAGNESTSNYVTLNDEGYGSVSWTPPAAGLWTVGASQQGLSLTMTKAVITAMPTVTDIYIPNKAQRFQPMGLISTVRAAENGVDVEGTMTFYEAGLGRLGSVEVEPMPGHRSLANFTWTPPGAGEFAFWTTFEPAIVPETGTTTSQPSTSAISRLTVVEHPVIVQLLMPPVMTIGHPSLVVAQLPDIYRGTVSLLVDGRQVSPDKETENGIAVFEWVPTHTGLTYVQLDLVSARHPLIDREVTQTVDVQPIPAHNPISVTPVINGVPGKPWADGEMRTHPAGTRISLVTSSGNGAAVTISQLGKCLVTGSVLYVPSAGGGCRVKFSAPGDGSFLSNTAELVLSGSVATPASASGKGKKPKS